MFESYSGARLLSRLALYALPWLLVGLLFEQVLLCLFIGSAVLHYWHYRHLNRLANWLWHDKRITPPTGSGSWEPVFNGIYRLQSKNRKRRSQLARLLSRFRQGADAMPDAAMVLGPGGEILWANKLASHVIGVRWPQDSGNRVHNLIRNPKFYKYWRKKRFNDPLEMISPVNDKRILELRVMTYGDDQRLMLVRDITRYRELENVRRDFVANVSHELRTPLTVLRGYLEMLQMVTASNPSLAKQVDAMEAQTGRMNELVESLLSLSRIQGADELDLDTEIDMKALLHDVRAEAEGLAGDNHQLEFSVDPELKIYGDRGQIHSACANLVQNAIRYSPDGGKIRVRWCRNGDHARFEVKDQGDGIAAEHLPRLTERFYRVDRARSRDTGGSGLGLAIVKHALNHHNSELEIQSDEGKGSLFAFELPAPLVVSEQQSLPSPP